MTELTNEQKSSVKLIKGQRDTYGWEIKVFIDENCMDMGKSKHNVPEIGKLEADRQTVERLKTIDARLKEQFGEREAKR